MGETGTDLTRILCEYFLRETGFSKEHFFDHDLLTIGSLPHCLTRPKVGEQSAFPSLTTALFAATGDFATFYCLS